LQAKAPLENPFNAMDRESEMNDEESLVERRTMLKGAMVMAGIVGAAQPLSQAVAQPAVGARLSDVPLSSGVRATIERRGQLVLIGINRPDVFNRFDPETSHALAVAFTGYEHDDTLRCAILFGHGDNFSRGIDVDAHKAAIGQPAAPAAAEDLVSYTGTNAKKRMTKPFIVVTHGDTWNAAHELHLAADIRICSADVRFGQDENTHGRYPGGGSRIPANHRDEMILLDPNSSHSALDKDTERAGSKN
jgi:hypothetical protein